MTDIVTLQPASLVIEAPDGLRSATVTFHLDTPADVMAGAAAHDVTPYYLPREGTGARWLVCTYEEAGATVTLIGPVEQRS